MKENRHDIFSTPIWGFILNDQKYQSKDYLDCTLNLEQTTQTVLKSNMGGFQTHDNLHQVPVFREFKEMVEKLGAGCYTSYSNQPCRATMTEMWGNINYQHSFNGTHIHGETLSGVFYIQVNKESGKLVLCNPAVRSDGKLIRQSNFSITPEPLACIMFPSWLEHYVEPNQTNQKRISISFNLRIEV